VIFPDDLEERYHTAARLFRPGRRVVAFTGAGFSVPSGIPDFRSASSGLWNTFDPMEVASLTAFRERPQAFFDWLEPLTGQIFQASPNPAHYALAQLQSSNRLETIITQNIDGLHQKAGASDVIELHGNMNHLVCLTCQKIEKVDDYLYRWLKEHILPVCPRCGAFLKPDIILYEEMLPVDAWEQAEFSCQQADVILVAGTSLEVMPASSLPLEGFQKGAQIVIMNLTPTFLDSVAEVVLPVDVAEGMPELCRQILA